MSAADGQGRIVDTTIRLLAEFAEGLRYEDIPADVLARARIHLADSVACAIAGSTSDQARIAAALCAGVTADPPEAGLVLGSARPTSAELAAFANTCMIRCLDYNDWYPRCHPSDTIGALFSASAWPGVDGRRLLTAVVTAYEVCGRVADSADLTRKGWDHTFPVGLGAVAGLGNLLALPAAVVAQALAITATANVALRSTRRGQLSLWKGAATAYATRNAMFAVQLARLGMSGPELPIEGRHGFWEQVSGRFEMAPFPTEGGDYLFRRMNLKYWPVEFNTQAAVWAAIRLARDIPLAELASVHIGMYWSAWHETASEPAKWDPSSRETADHSLPYIFIKALQDGGITASTFDERSYRDPALRPQMAKVTAAVDSACDEAWPGRISVTCHARALDGRRLSFTESDPRGTWRNPMDLADVRAKFLALAGPVLTAPRAEELLESLLRIDTDGDVTSCLRLAIPP